MGRDKEVIESILPSYVRLPDLCMDVVFELCDFRSQRLDHFSDLPKLARVIKNLACSPPTFSDNYFIYETLRKVIPDEVKNIGSNKDLRKVFGDFASRMEAVLTNSSNLKPDEDEIHKLEDFCLKLSITSLQLDHIYEIYSHGNLRFKWSFQNRRYGTIGY